MHLLTTEAPGSDGPHLDSRTHYLGGLSCRRCLLLHRWLLGLLHHHRSSDLVEEGRIRFGATESRAPTTSGGALKLEAFHEEEDGIVTSSLVIMSP